MFMKKTSEALLLQSPACGGEVPAVSEIIKSKKLSGWTVAGTDELWSYRWRRKFISLCHHEGWEIIYRSLAGEHWWWSLLISFFSPKTLLGLFRLRRGVWNDVAWLGDTICRQTNTQSGVIIWTSAPATTQEPDLRASSCGCEHLRQRRPKITACRQAEPF